MVQSQMVEVPDNRMPQMVEIKHTEEVYKITVFFKYLKIYYWSKELGRYILGV